MACTPRIPAASMARTAVSALAEFHQPAVFHSPVLGLYQPCSALTASLAAQADKPSTSAQSATADKKGLSPQVTKSPQIAKSPQVTKPAADADNVEESIIDRIEVTKGPNAILSPAGAPGGALNIIRQQQLGA